MARKSTTPKPPPNDIQMYSGLVRMFSGPKYTQPIEDMAIERFPATSAANARAFLITAARKWLDEGGYPERGGIQVLYCGLDGEPSVQTTVLAVVEGGKPPKQTYAPVVTYKAFTCPIVSLCKRRYVGRVDHISDTLLLTEEE